MGSRSNIHPSSGFDGSSLDDDILFFRRQSTKRSVQRVQLIKMFLNTTGYSNLGSLAELVKDETTTNASATVTYAVTSSSATNSAANASSDMQQMVNPQSLQQQQQLLERMRKRMGVDGNAFNPMNSRHEQQIHQQFRKQQQQIAALSNMQQQQQQPGYNQFRQLMTTTLQNQIVQRKQLMVDFVKRIVNVKLKAVASRGCPVLMPSLHAERSWFDPETKF
ncbi:hypothetical protein Bca4012_005367 [Brassica carinata]|uniref:Uncharacterized protein n=2 Tax=Brassica TaxID=3705 RepID=A0A3P6AQH9_BRAOL|nr:unnamed protein product [Brassica napus]CDY60362.1 BnaCnng36140D [Brassica napus]VDC94942.1 unnamed protein product [Brassica oleracea]